MSQSEHLVMSWAYVVKPYCHGRRFKQFVMTIFLHLYHLALGNKPMMHSVKYPNFHFLTWPNIYDGTVFQLVHLPRSNDQADWPHSLMKTSLLWVDALCWIAWPQWHISAAWSSLVWSIVPMSPPDDCGELYQSCIFPHVGNGKVALLTASFDHPVCMTLRKAWATSEVESS